MYVRMCCLHVYGNSMASKSSTWIIWMQLGLNHAREWVHFEYFKDVSMFRASIYGRILWFSHVFWRILAWFRTYFAPLLGINCVSGFCCLKPLKSLKLTLNYHENGSSLETSFCCLKVNKNAFIKTIVPATGLTWAECIIYVCVCVYVFMYTCIYYDVCMYVCMYMYVCVYIYIYIYMFIYICLYSVSPTPEEILYAPASA